MACRTGTARAPTRSGSIGTPALDSSHVMATARTHAAALLRHQWASHGAVVWGMVTFVVAVAFLGKFGSTSTVATMTGIDTRPPREFF